MDKQLWCILMTNTLLLLLSNKKEQTTVTHNVGKSQKHHVEQKKPEEQSLLTKDHFYDILEQAKQIFGDRNHNSDGLCRGGEQDVMTDWERARETFYSDGMF